MDTLYLIISGSFLSYMRNKAGLDKAIETAEESKQVSKQYQISQSLMNASEKLSELYEQKGSINIGLTKS